MKKDRTEFEARYYSIFSSKTHTIIILNKDGIIQDLNNLFPGLKKTDVVGKKLMDLQNDEILKAQHQKYINKAIKEKTEQTYLCETSHHGNTVFYRTSVNPIIENNKVEGAVVISQDITKEIDFKNSLEKSERLYRNLVENSNSVIIRIARNGKIIYVNPYTTKLYGYKNKELIGEYIWDTLVPKINSRGIDLVSLFEEALESPQKYENTEIETLKKSGEQVWLSLAIHPEKDHQQVIKEFLCIGNNITEIKKTQSAHRKQSRILNQVQESIVCTDLNGIITYANDNTYEMYGYVKGYLNGKHFNVFYPEEDFEELEASNFFDEFLKTGKHRLEVRNITNDGNEIWVDLSLSLLYDDKREPYGMVGYGLDITEKKEKEVQTLRLASIIENANEFVAFSDLKGNLLYVNNAGQEYLNIPKNQTLKVSDLFNKQDHDRLMNEIWPKLKTEHRWAGEFRVKDFVSDKTTPILFDIFFIWDEKGKKPINIATVSQNISNMVEQREMLQQNELELKAAQSLGKIGSWQYDFSLDKMFWSDQMYKLFDYGINEITPSHLKILECVIPEEKEKYKAKMKRLLNTNETLTRTFKIISKKGESKYLISKCKTIFNEGQPVKSIGTMMDVTEQKRAELLLQEHQNQLELIVKEKTQELKDTLSELEENEQKYRMLVNSTAVGICIAQDSKIVFANAGAVELLGASSAEELKHGTVWNIISEQSKEEQQKRYQKIKEGKTVSDDTELWIKRKNGDEVCCRVMVKGIIYEGQPARHTSFIDITALKITQQRLKKSEQRHKNISKKLSKNLNKLKKRTEELEIANQDKVQALKSKDEFLSTISHEIRTPLNSIIGLGQILERKINSDIERDILRILNRSSSNLHQLITDILDFSKIRAKKLEIIEKNVELNKFLEDVVSIHKSAADEKNLELRLSKNSDAPLYVEVDALRLQQILNNLISNAIKYTHSGIVRIELLTKQVNKKKIKAEFKISDTGIGISKKDQRKVFEPFVRGDLDELNSTGGTGLGLSIVKSLVELLGGEINFSSKEDYGTTFSLEFDLELAKKSSIVKENELKPKDNHFLKGKRILYAEDVSSNQFLMNIFLQDFGIECIMAKNGKEAIEVLENEHVDLICMDIHMPVMDGYEATKIIREEMDLKVPIIAFTADTTIKTRKRIKQAGMNALITKPIDFNEFNKLLEKFLLRKEFSLTKFKFYDELFSGSSEKRAKFFTVLKKDLISFKNNLHQGVLNYDKKVIRSEIHKMSSIVIHLNSPKLVKLMEELRQENLSKKHMQHIEEQIESCIDDLLTGI